MEEYERHKFREVTQANKLHVICFSRVSRNKVSIGCLSAKELRFSLQKSNLKGVEGSSSSKSFLIVKDLFVASAVETWNLRNMQVCLYDLQNAV